MKGPSRWHLHVGVGDLLLRGRHLHPGILLRLLRLGTGSSGERAQVRLSEYSSIFRP